jgi:hypothetical protein
VARGGVEEDIAGRVGGEDTVGEVSMEIVVAGAVSGPLERLSVRGLTHRLDSAYRGKGDGEFRGRGEGKKSH